MTVNKEFSEAPFSIFFFFFFLFLISKETYIDIDEKKRCTPEYTGYI